MKYKLIKEYPNSPKLNSIVEEDSNGIFFKRIGELIYLYTKDQIKDYPEFWEEVKEPLFITEDGKSVYVGDIYYTVFIKEDCIETFKVMGKWIAKELDEYTSWSKDCKYFSSKEAAEKYIEENKPLYSKKQVINILKGFDRDINCFDERFDYNLYIEIYKDEKQNSDEV